MAFLSTTNDPARDIKELLDKLEISQWHHKTNFEYLNGFPILTKEDLRRKKTSPGFYSSSTSGSTGEPVTVQQTYLDHIWVQATNIRELRWRKWDLSKNLAVISHKFKRSDVDSWGIPSIVESVQGKGFLIGNEPISVIQEWLEEKNPHYISAFPSIISQLDLSKISNFIDSKGTGEAGGSLYSSEECGTIAIQCPDNPDVMHVMENIIVEESENGALITNLINPHIKRYQIGDHVELGECNCGRSLQTIKSIKGRIRNMLVLQNGDKVWPMLGSKVYYEEFGIKRYKAVQTSIENIDLYIISEPLGEREKDLIEVVKKWIGVPIGISLKYVDGFEDYKFEEFKSLIA